MTDLKTQLKELFVDNEKSSDMMFEECGYDEELDAMGVTYKMVYHYGGEGDGDSFTTVWEFDDGTEIVYVDFYGWYASYNGAEYTDWNFVTPKQVTKTEYV